MSVRLDRARKYREGAKSEGPMRYQPIAKPQSLMLLGSAGAAVLELWSYCHGLAEAHDVQPPFLPNLSPEDGEAALAWVDRVSAALASWHREHFG